ncbi:dihydropteroate synthase [Blochmannia endosymbiont of Camponotus sp. C-003]|uniref:dihydropteroate synthase n=1 Tax=unclassified Candidatus Blochmanniella TaxID=711328 RepID=UPI002024DE70|nr:MULTISPECIES: dihydropteroate synthase [unclassified Candidatus Blochmannia]URJ23135.1 dihydropteroate synthase [Blochmannia endosymbiont of Camponotus sp. C-003]URJ28604.1 dihydropteroate synthase [Blochmannia endosymbiont of Camponotus sp. C-046]
MTSITNKRILDFSKIQIMGILNVSPDSFFDGGDYCVLPKAIDRVFNMITDGATCIDVGGESTRPGSDVVSDEEEADRVIPVVRAIAERFDTYISINTSSALIIRESAAIGAHLINDVRSLTAEGAMQAALYCKLPVCLVHMQGEPKTMQNSPIYSNVTRVVNEYFVQQITRFESEGISRNKLLLDPGFGFGKSLLHNYQLLANLKYFHHFGLPLLVGISRKSMLSLSSNSYHPKQRLIGSIACAVIAAIQGVQIIRVHDVKETAEALKVVQMMLQEQNKDKN